MAAASPANDENSAVLWKLSEEACRPKRNTKMAYSHGGDTKVEEAFI
jgi:hypothetical protein